MKSLGNGLLQSGPIELLLIQGLLLDVGLACGVDVERDIRYVQRRFGKEGLSFLTIALPKLSVFLDRAVSGRLEEPQGFRLCKDRKYPAFMSGFTSLVLEPDGSLRSDANPTAFWAVRQVSRFYKKIEIDCTPERCEAAILKFVETDIEVGMHVPNRDDFLSHWKRVCNLMYGITLADLDDVWSDEVQPRHGSGAVAERLIREEKYAHAFWPVQLAESFPIDLFWWKPELGMGWDEKEPCSRLVTVPKDQEKPRLIAVESTPMQWCQQALMQRTYGLVESSWLNSHIGFRDQTRNQELARVGSLGGGYSTLDLSEASDRVHPKYVEWMFESLPSFTKALFDSRTGLVELPGCAENGFQPVIHRLAKFATMGSAMCFPVQTMLFFSICMAVATWASRDRLSYPLLRETAARERISVFGDDIVVPTHLTDEVVAKLTAFGFVVNENKSFKNGPFRESCGGDFFNGVRVTPVYLRTESPTGMANAHAVVSWVATSNLLHKEGGCWLTADCMRSVVEDITGPLLAKAEETGYLSWRSFVENIGPALKAGNYKFDSDLQCFQYWGIAGCPKMKDSSLDGEIRLFRNLFTKRTPVLPGLDEAPEMESFERPYSVKLRRKWFSLAS